MTDLEETVRSIEAATEKAERMAGVHISHVYVGVTGEHVHSQNNRGVVAVSGEEREVGRADVRRVVEASRLVDVGSDRQIIHALPRQFARSTGKRGSTDPDRDVQAPAWKSTRTSSPAGATFVTNVLKCVHRAGLEPAGIVFEPLASSAATLACRKRSTSACMLARYRRRYDRHRRLFGRRRDPFSATIPVGGNILSNDIALGLEDDVRRG
jgi:cell division protein FtsA